MGKRNLDMDTLGIYSQQKGCLTKYVFCSRFIIVYSDCRETCNY